MLSQKLFTHFLFLGAEGVFVSLFKAHFELIGDCNEGSWFEEGDDSLDSLRNAVVHALHAHFALLALAHADNYMF